MNMDPEKNVPMVASTSAIKNLAAVVYQGPSQIVSEEVTNDQTQHCVVSFNMHDWQKLCKAIEPACDWEAQIERSDTEDESDDEDDDDDDDEEEEEEESEEEESQSESD